VKYEEPINILVNRLFYASESIDYYCHPTNIGFCKKYADKRSKERVLIVLQNTLSI